MLSETTINPKNTTWIPGHKYRFTYKVQTWKIPFTDVSLISQERKSRSIQETVERFEQTHKDKLIVDNWNAYFTPGYPEKLEIDVTAISNASPVIIIAAAVIALGAVFACVLLLDKVSELVETLDPLDIGIPGIGLAIIGIGIVGYMILGRYRGA
jgi:hypothetical protein